MQKGGKAMNVEEVFEAAGLDVFELFDRAMTSEPPGSCYRGMVDYVDVDEETGALLVTLAEFEFDLNGTGKWNPSEQDFLHLTFIHVEDLEEDDGVITFTTELGRTWVLLPEGNDFPDIG